MKFITFIILGGLLISTSCKNDPKATDIAANTVDTAATTKSSADVSKFENLDHNFNITPEGSRIFFKGFFQNKLVDGAATINKGTLHVKDGIITEANLMIDMNTAEMVVNRDDAIEKFMRSKAAFDGEKFPDASFKITECTKAVNDQQATHVLKGTITMRGVEIPVSVRARIDYKNKLITISTDQIILKASDLKMKMSDPSQDNVYFNMMINGELF